MASGSRTIVISDIHLSDGNEYSSFSPPDSNYLTFLLNAICDKSFRVEELVLLGDVFDLWLYPVDVVPSTVGDIIKANSSIKEAIERCVKSIPKVYLLKGNHDMRVTEKDLEPFDSGGENRIRLIDTDCYKKKHDGMRHFEHGHKADMFNAEPEIGEDTIGGYPLGYFLTRLTAREHPGIWDTVRKICENFLGPLTWETKAEKSLETLNFLGETLVRVLIGYIQAESGIKDETPIRFTERELDEQYVVGDIKNHYGDLFGKWHKKYPGTDIFRSMFASRRLKGGLEWYAEKILAAPSPPKMVVMGHTHQFVVDHEGYSNDGAFCETRNLSCLEIVDNKPAIIARLSSEPDRATED
ncbi:MAG: metallophosphoesterase [Desulfomonilaceae bacterium]